MRSRTCDAVEESPDQGDIQTMTDYQKCEENSPKLTKRIVNTEQDENKTVTGKKKTKPAGVRKKTAPELSKQEMIQLLGIMEGEVQAREDIIGLLRSHRSGPELLEAHYGSAVPLKPLQALQRDAALANSRQTEDVYERPMAELDRVEEKEKETYRRMLEQLLLAEKCHRRTVMELDNEKRKHADFIDKSDDFTNLLEHERERLKRLLEQEKAYQARKDKEHSHRMEKVQTELVKLKSFTLMLVDERQLHVKQIDQQNQKIQDLTQKVQEKEQRLATCSETINEDAQKILKLEAELEQKSAKFGNEQEDMTNKLLAQDSQMRQLRLKLIGLSNKMEELEERNKVLQKSHDDLQELREKISDGECGNSSLVTELESLRKRVLEMEGKDEELTKMETQCKELKKKLQDEENQSKELRLEVVKVQKRMGRLEKLEEAFNKSKSECSQLCTNLKKEKGVAKDLSAELEAVKARVKDLEAAELKFEKAELLLKDDIMKLKSFTVLMVDERKNLTERLKQEEQKCDEINQKFIAEQSKVMDNTEKLIEESKKLRKLKSEMEDRVTELEGKLMIEEEKRKEINVELNEANVRIKALEEEEKDLTRKLTVNEPKQEEKNKIQELHLEIERLRSRLKHLEIVEGDLMKTEDEYDLLEKRFRTEQDKANTLTKMLEEMKEQVMKNKATEKGKASSENELKMRVKMEEGKRRELQAEVQALKEKIHELMNKEDQLSQLQVEYSVLQRRFLEEEVKKAGMTREVMMLTQELEASKRYSRALRPSMHGRRIMDVPLMSTAVQTDPASSEDETAAGFIKKSVQEENNLMNNLRQRCLVKKPSVLERYPPASAELAGKKTWIPWIKKKEGETERKDSLRETKNKDGKGGKGLQMQGRPLHIRFTPDHKNSRATLEITSPKAEDFFSSTTIIPTLGLQNPKITIVPKPTTDSTKLSMDGLDRAKSPVTITAFSKTKSPEKGSCSESFQSPVSIITVSTTPINEVPDTEIQSGRTVIKMGPENQLTQRNYSSSSSIITTEDNKIHIHLGTQYKRQNEVNSQVLTMKPLGLETGTVLGSPRQAAAAVKTTQSKMTSSIMITPTSGISRPTLSTSSSEAASTHSLTTRIPVSKTSKPGSKAFLGLSTVTRLESRAESMKIELRKSAVCSSVSASGEKQ